MPRSGLPFSLLPFHPLHVARTALPVLTAVVTVMLASCGDSGSGSSTGGGGSAGTMTSTTGGAGTGGGGTAGSTTTSTTGGGGTGGDPGCKSDADCMAPLVCDVSTGDCVQCTPDNDICAQGLFCTPGNVCQVGCTEDADCSMMTHCDTSKHACVGCVIDTNCAPGSICVNETCIPGCSGVQPCQPGASCCGQICADLANDVNNCGLCNTECPVPPHGVPVCVNSQCALGQCNANYADCNQDPSDGCERNIVADGPCVCNPGEVKSCYNGAPGTQGIGVCKAGTSTCVGGVEWGPCVGEVIPSYELCNQLDDDCDGQIEKQPCQQCTPADVTCNGNVAHGCAPDGLSFVDEVCDPLQGTTCNPTTGHCDGTCGLSQLGQSYIGCDYFPTVTANLVDTTFHFAVAVSNTTAQTATVTVTKGASTITTVMVAPNSVQIIQLPWDLTLKGPASGSVVPFPASVKVVGGAYRLRSNQPVTVYQFNPLEYTIGALFSYSNDASILLPVNVWTGKYRVAARHHFAGGSGFYAVTAREDNTVVTVTPAPGGGTVKTGIPGLNADGTGSFTLNAGDVAEIVTNGTSSQSDPNDVTGTLVTATKNVQVIGGHQCIYIPDLTGYCDHLEESVFPEQTLSTTYIVTAPLIPTGGATPKVNMVRVIATQPNTTLAYEPAQGGAPTTISQAGQWIEIANTSADFRITGSQPILVVQYMEGQAAGGNSGDPAMTIAVGQEQYRNSYLFHAPTNYEYSYMNVVAPAGTTVTLDGTNIPAASFTAIGATGYSVARATLSNAGNGNHTITGTKAFGISVYGYGQYTSYWYPGGSNLTKLHN